MKKELGTAASLALFCASSVLAEDATRELGAHEHGHSALNIAIEGDRVEMELMAPGADIVGFEHEVASADDQAVVTQGESGSRRAAGTFWFHGRCRLCRRDRFG